MVEHDQQSDDDAPENVATADARADAEAATAALSRALTRLVRHTKRLFSTTDFGNLDSAQWQGQSVEQLMSDSGNKQHPVRPRAIRTICTAI